MVSLGNVVYKSRAFEAGGPGFKSRRPHHDTSKSLLIHVSYFKAEAEALLYMVIEELFYLKQLRSKNIESYQKYRLKLSRALEKIESMPEELNDEIIPSIAKALYLTTPIYLI